MKPTSAVALMLGMWVLSGWGWGVTQAAESTQGSSFKQWCQQQASLSVEARITVEVLLAEAGTSDCERAAKTLSSRTELRLENDQITDVNPLAGLTNLEWLSLNNNQIADVTPLARLTNLKELYLTDNPIPSDSSQGAQPICPVSPPNVCKFEDFPPAKTY